jgi:heptaprenyl diphosphate synthase
VAEPDGARAVLPLARNPLLQMPSMAEDLARVDTELRRAVETDDELLTEIAAHLVKAGGKRLRPGFAIACAAAGGQHGPAHDDVVLGGVSVELVHLGSLYHADVMDEAKTRHHVESVNSRWGNLKAILGGDFLLAKASEIAASLGTEVAGLLAATIARLCEGQVRELRNMFNVARSEDAYLAAIAGKTAALFSAACRIGGLVARHPRPVIDRLTVFGTQYGMAFQIVDDILDVVATDEQLGKPAGNDMVQGVYTLPVIRTLAGADGDNLRPLLGKPLSVDEVDRAKALVTANGTIPGSIATAREYVRRAVEAIEPLEGSLASDALRGAADHLLASIPSTAAAE